MYVEEVSFVSADDAFEYDSGLFSARLVSDGQDVTEGPRAVSVQEAIEWGRGQSPVVLVAVGDGELGGPRWFSAGSLDPPGRDISPWPAEGLRALRHSRRQGARD